MLERLKKAAQDFKIDPRVLFPPRAFEQIRLVPEKRWDAEFPGWLKWLGTGGGAVVLAYALSMLLRECCSDRRGNHPWWGATPTHNPAERGPRFVRLGKDGKGGIMYTHHDHDSAQSE
jgi:hypothetical protein